MKMKRGLLFDCDGVLGDTEPYGHLVAFNQMWKKLGVPWEWSKEGYGVKLKIAGGKERMASLFRDADFLAHVTVPEGEEERKSLIARWHKEKTDLYEQIISSGVVPTRPGIRRISKEALQAGWKLAVASTSAPKSVEAMLQHAVGEMASEFTVVCGDVVKAKKPAPDIYNLALEQMGLAAHDCVAIEDSRNGVLAAYGAGIPVVVTVSEYTVEEDFREADLVVDSLGDPGGPTARVLANPSGAELDKYVTLETLATVVEHSTARKSPA